ncbi:hypothetical protein [Pelagibacterium xiamenense]|uniref:hypothetical protein n=1 Tax=Pelagibacterium xiamenense TaxID=2901140 RepID=UPI001E5B8A5D|nr:hypothetical protein [Pelagibacterium xiamenense]MCD7058640.1 hypothetical protein [Pelagibacterium xiamenense]
MQNRNTLLIAALAASCWPLPAHAQTLGLTTEQFIAGIEAASQTTGEPLSFQELACAENPMPGDATKTIVSCTFTLGGGRLFITNAEPDGPLLDISTQPWAGGEGGAGSQMISFIAATINDADPSAFRADAESLIETVADNGDGSATMGQISFYVLDFDGNLTITAQP